LRKSPILICGYSSASINFLAFASETMEVYTRYSELDNIQIGDLIFCHYHLSDEKFLINLGNNVYTYTKEKCIIDTIMFLDKNYNEGLLIEMLQNYAIQEKRNFNKLYEIGEYYKIKKDRINYWIKEADGETDMSMN